MADITFDDITQTDFDTAEAYVISLLRAEYPSLDLRRGTVLRDLLVRPAAELYALDSARMEDLRTRMSLAALQESGTAEPSDVDAILFNFNITRRAGTYAQGQLLVKVDAARIYTIAAATRFETLDGLAFETPQLYTIRTGADTDGGQLELYPANDGSYYFLLPVTATAVGVQYNVVQGTSMDPVASIYGFITAEAYTAFAGGLDQESLDAVIARLPVAISNRSLTSRTSIEAKLRDQFDGTDVSIQSLGVQGMGDEAQIRDKHNPLGFTTGSRVDVYARTFTAPNVVVIRKTGTKTAANTYQIPLTATDAPGFYAVRSVAETESTLAPAMNWGALPVVGSYAFTDIRAASGIAQTFHDIDADNSMIETAFSVFQSSVLTVTGVPYSEDTHDFKIELYTAPGLTDLQEYVDSLAVRNTEADVLVRCPLICTVGLSTRLYYAPGSAIDTSQMISDVCAYINSRSFVDTLTRSELAGVLLDAGASRVDLTTAGTTLQGYIRDAAGETHRVQGDVLDINDVADGSVLLTPDTCVFAAEPHDIYIQALVDA
jgi:hypothetical protein